jgi:dihydropyrimidinase
MADLYDLVLSGGSVVNHDGVRRADVAIRDGVVAALAAPMSQLPAVETIDVSGKHLFPGAVDPHTHFTTNVRPVGDYISRETPSMALGGTTTVIEFLGNAESYHAHAPEVIREIEARSYVDVACHIILNSDQHLAEMEDYVASYGITSFKMFMAAGGRTHIYPQTWSVDDGLVFQALKKIARFGGRVVAVIHTENWEIARALRAELEQAGRTDPAAWTESRPNICEVDGMRRIAGLAATTGAHVYAVHLSTREAPGILQESRSRGIPFFGETCPHYLMIHAGHPSATLAKYNPAIKEGEDSEALWQALADGVLDCVGTDHIPVRRADKEPGKDNIWTARAGVPGSGTILPVLLSEGVAKRGIALERVAAASSYNAARLFGLYPRKGAIAVGSDADIVVTDMRRKVVVSPELLQLDFTLFDGQEFTGWPEMTILHGRIVARGSRLAGEAGSGSYLRRSATVR